MTPEEIARSIVIQWLDETGNSPAFGFVESEVLQHCIATAIREAEARGLERALQAVSLLSPYTLELERAHAAIRRLIDEAR